MSVTASTLENVSDTLVAGVVAVITADGTNFPLPGFGPRDSGAASKNRVEVKAGNAIRASDQMNRGADAVTWYYNHRRVSLSAIVSTQRSSLTAKGASSVHGVAIGRLRWLLSRGAQKLLPTVVTYEILDVVDMGEVYTYDEADHTDRTELRFQVDLVIPSANYSDV